MSDDDREWWIANRVTILETLGYLALSAEMGLALLRDLARSAEDRFYKVDRDPRIQAVEEPLREARDRLRRMVGGGDGP